jgi:hypothetical protein
MHEVSKIRGIMRKTVVTLGLAFVFLVVVGRDVRAQVSNSVDFTLSPGSQAALTAATGMSGPDLERLIRSKLDGLFQVTNAGRFLQNFGDAQSFTSKGMGVDYASEATYFEVGGATSFALGMDRTYQPGNTNGFPIQGVGLNASVMGGVSLGFLGIPVMLFGNGMHVPTQRYGDMSGSLDNWGVHAQLRLFGPSRGMSGLKMLVRWGGIAVTTGFDYSHMHLGLTHDVVSNFSIPSSTNTADVNVDVRGSASGQAHFNVDMTTKSIPLELTTSLRLLTLLTVYGGMGFDFQLGGGSAVDLALDASMLGHIPPTATQGASNPDLGTAQIHAVANVDPSAAKIRGILGLQVNLFMVRLFTQVNIADTNPTMASLAAGVRVAY